VSWDRRALLAGALAAGASAAVAGEPPRRIVSLNSCLDVMLVHLADRGQIAALSHFAREDQGSTIAPLARTLPFTWETAEEVIALEPDLVLASRHSSPATRAALKRLDMHVEAFSTPKTVAESLDQVRRMGVLVGRPRRGEAEVARIEAAIAAARPPAGTRPLKALVFQPNGFSAGPGTLVDELMTSAGFENVARRYGLKTWGNVDLERLIADPPQVLLVGEASPGGRSWAERVMTHPALTNLSGRMHQARFPEKLLYCGGPVMAETSAALARARHDAVEAHA
jgi:iron complex transport system substrate-binding protein